MTALLRIDRLPKECPLVGLRSCRDRSAIARAIVVGIMCLLAVASLAQTTPTTQHHRRNIDLFIAEASVRFAIPERWIVAVIQQESGGDPTAVSSKGARGLMQLMPRTWDELRDRHDLGADPFDPRDNILAGTAYLHGMLDRYGTVDHMLAAYNAGPTRVDELLQDGRPLPPETRAYVAIVRERITSNVAPADHYARPSDPMAAPLFVAPTAMAETFVAQAGRSPPAPVKPGAGDAVGAPDHRSQAFAAQSQHGQPAGGAAHPTHNHEPPADQQTRGPDALEACSFSVRSQIDADERPVRLREVAYDFAFAVGCRAEVSIGGRRWQDKSREVRGRGSGVFANAYPDFSRCAERSSRLQASKFCQECWRFGTSRATLP